MANTAKALPSQPGLRWGGLTTKWYVVAFVMVVASSFLNKLPGGWLGAYVYATLLGLLLDRIGEKTPIVKDYFGGGSIVTIFGGAILVYFDVIPQQTATALKSFVTSMDYIGWVVGALICGSILSMDRRLLIRAGVLYLIPILGGIAAAFGLAALGGALMGYGAVKAIMLIALPIMGGGTSAGAVPLSQIYGSALNADPKQFLSMVMPAVALGNALSIVSGGMLNRAGKAMPSLSGEGILMKGFEAERDVAKSVPDYTKLGVGFLTTGVFFAIGCILEKFIPMHYYALTIISVAVVKLLDILPEELIEASTQWYDLLIKTAIPAVLLGIGMVYTDMKLVIPALTFQYLVLVGLTVCGAILGAGFFGRLVGFYPIESSITAGLCMSNMGGTGDVATLGAANRMMLMPFAQISSRIGGAVILVIGSIMIKLLGVG